MDAGLEEPICTLIWASPRLYSDVPELREVSMLKVVHIVKSRNNVIILTSPINISKLKITF